MLMDFLPLLRGQGTTGRKVPPFLGSGPKEQVSCYEWLDSSGGNSTITCSNSSGFSGSNKTLATLHRRRPSAKKGAPAVALGMR